MLTCPSCNAIGTLQKRGIRNNRQRYWCSDCDEWCSVDLEEMVEADYTPQIPILVMDIESGLRRAKLFSSGKQWVNANAFEDKQWMICWSGIWYGDSKPFGDCVTPQEAKDKDHSRVVKSLWDAMSKASVIITHNGINFDSPMVTEFFIREKLGLPSKYKNIDTCAISRKLVRVDSYRLDFLCKYFGLNTGKDKMEHDDWEKCYYGDKKSLDKMFKYNLNDVMILQDYMNCIRPYVSTFAQYGIYGDVEESVCPYCGSTNFRENGSYYSPNGKYTSYRCECQALFRSKKNLLSKTKRSNLMAF